MKGSLEEFMKKTRGLVKQFLKEALDKLMGQYISWVNLQNTKTKKIVREYFPKDSLEDTLNQLPKKSLKEDNKNKNNGRN